MTERDERHPVLDRPWHRPGAARYALSRVLRALRPRVSVEDVPVRLEVRDSRDHVFSVRDEPNFPPDGVHATELFLGRAG